MNKYKTAEHHHRDYKIRGWARAETNSSVRTCKSCLLSTWDDRTLEFERCLLDNCLHNGMHLVSEWGNYLERLVLYCLFYNNGLLKEEFRCWPHLWWGTPWSSGLLLPTEGQLFSALDSLYNLICHSFKFWFLPTRTHEVVILTR